MHPERAGLRAGFFVLCKTMKYFWETIHLIVTMKITNESEYEKASERADELFDAKKGTPEEKELQELLKAIKEYEDDFVRMLRDNN